jgi:REP-associated tyrosine transposase
VSYWRLFYHLVWATYERLPLINPDIERLIRGVLHSKAKDLGIFIHESGMVADHVHLVVSIPPTLAIAEVVSQLKGSTSHAVNHLSERASTRFQWQDGYAVLSVGEPSLPSVLAYVHGQKEHHAHGTTNDVFERLAPEHKVKKGQ